MRFKIAKGAAGSWDATELKLFDQKQWSACRRMPAFWNSSSRGTRPAKGQLDASVALRGKLKCVTTSQRRKCRKFLFPRLAHNRHSESQDWVCRQDTLWLFFLKIKKKKKDHKNKVRPFSGTKRFSQFPCLLYSYACCYASVHLFILWFIGLHVLFKK